VTDHGFPLAQLQEAGITRYVSRGATNITARRAWLPAYSGKGRRPRKGAVVRPLPRPYKGRTLPATPADRCETWQGGTPEAPCLVRAQFWDHLVLTNAAPGAPTFTTVVIHDPRFAESLLLNTPLPLSGAQGQAMYQGRWPVEGLPLWAKQMLGAVRQFVFAPASCQRLPELALLAGSILAYTAATARQLTPGSTPMEHPRVHGCHTARPVDGLLGSYTAPHRWPAASGAGPSVLRRLAGATRTTSQKTVADRTPAYRCTGASQTEKSNAYVL